MNEIEHTKQTPVFLITDLINAFLRFALNSELDEPQGRAKASQILSTLPILKKAFLSRKSILKYF